MPPQPSKSDPWRRAPVSELQDQVLPRWFVLLAVVMVPLALVVMVAALVLTGPDEQPVAERRPPPANGLSNDVGEYNVGTSAPQELSPVCPRLRGIAIAGSEQDRKVLRQGLVTLCRVDLTTAAEAGLAAFAEAGGVVRFAQFEATGVDSTVLLEDAPPVILANNKFASTEPRWIAPIVAHDVVMLAGEPASGATALAARQAEDVVCDAIADEVEPSRGCVDAAQLLALPDPLAALRDAGYP